MKMLYFWLSFVDSAGLFAGACIVRAETPKEALEQSRALGFVIEDHEVLGLVIPHDRTPAVRWVNHVFRTHAEIDAFDRSHMN